MSSIEKQPFDGRLGVSDDPADALAERSDRETLSLMVWLSQFASSEDDATLNVPRTPESLPRHKVLGHFVLQSVLGSGAYGVVFRANDLHEDREIALKVAWPSVMFNPSASRRFVQEAEIASALDHPGIVRVLGFGWIDAVCYIAQELVDGPTLADWMQEQPSIDPKQAALIVLQLATAVDTAHQIGIVHRDLKPRNVLLRPHGSSPLGFDPLVSDFGLARRPGVSDLSLATATGAIVGSDHYMSPEQATGSAEVGPASDVFSLGVMLYEIVVGQRPFDGASSEEVRQKIQLDEPRPPRRLCPGLSKDLQTIVLKSLEKSPDQRYESARQLAADLGQYLAGRPVSARPVSRWRKLRQFTRRRPVLASVTAVTALSLSVIAALAVAWTWDRFSQSRVIQTAQASIVSARQAAEAAQRAEAQTDEVRRQQLYPLQINRAYQVLQSNGRRQALEELERCRALAFGSVQRGLEWDWFWGQLNSEEITLHAHPKGVQAVLFDHTGDRLISAGREGRIFIWDTKTWSKQQELIYAEDVEINDMELSADGKYLAAGGDDGRLVVYRLGESTPIFDQSIIRGRLSELTWIGSTTEIAVGGTGEVLWVVNVISGNRRSQSLDISPESRAVYPFLATEIGSIAYLADRDALAITVTPFTEYILNATTLQELSQSLKKHAETCASCGLAPGFMATADGIGLKVWETGTGALVAENPWNGARIRSLRYSKEAEVIAVGFQDGTIELCNLDDVLSKRHLWSRRIYAHSDRVASMAFSPDGTWLVSGGWDGDLKLFRSRVGGRPFDVRLPATPFHVEFSPCGRWLAIGNWLHGKSGLLTMFDVRSGRQLWSTTSLPLAVKNIPVPYYSQLKWAAFDSTGEEVLFFKEDSTLQVVETQSGLVKTRHTLPSGNAIEGVLGTAVPGLFLLQSNLQKTKNESLILDRKSGIAAAENPAPCLGMFPTKRGNLWLHLISSQRLELRSSVKRETCIELSGFTGHPLVADSSPGGRYLALGTTDNTISCWDLVNGGPPTRFLGHTALVLDVKFSPNGRTLLSRGNDGTLRFWDVATQAQMLVLGEGDVAVLSMDVSPQGDLLVLGVQYLKLGHAGLQIHRLGDACESLPNGLKFTPPDQP